jgi:hypothetical protein
MPVSRGYHISIKWASHQYQEGITSVSPKYHEDIDREVQLLWTRDFETKKNSAEGYFTELRFLSKEKWIVMDCEKIGLAYQFLLTRALPCRKRSQHPLCASCTAGASSMFLPRAFSQRGRSSREKLSTANQAGLPSATSSAT